MANHQPSSSPPPPPPPPCKTYELTACSISYSKPTNSSPFLHFYTNLNLNLSPGSTSSPSSSSILNNISFTARPSELLAIVGPSGAGKSTLLDILSARTSPSSGHLLLNSSPLHPSTFRKLSTYVPQHDSSLPLLTVSETFHFAARLLIPSSSHSDSTSLVASLLSDLGLSHLSHTRLSHGLSGGERRRISIGLSLLHDPAVLLLDEPTSGLDSASAFNVVHSLKTIAVSRRRTVILSIHQPSSKLLSVFDSVLLMNKGSVVHHGSVASLDRFLVSAGFTAPAQLNPLEFALEILNELPLTTNNNDNVIGSMRSKPISIGSYKKETIQYTSSRAHEILALYSRFWKIIFRSKQLLLTNTLEALIVGFLLGTIYIHIGYDKQGMDKRLGFFAFTLTFLLSSTTETLPIFISERPILLRETSSGVYRLSSHLIANTLVFLPYLFAISLLYSSSVYFVVGLCTVSWTAFLNFVLIVWAVILTANSFVLFISSLSPNYIAGTSLVTVSLAGFFLFSGYFLSKESMPGFWLFMHYVSPYKYALDALLANEYGCEERRCFEWSSVGGCEVRGRDVLERKGLRVVQKWENLEVLFGFFVFYRVLYWVVLSRRVSACKR